MSLIAAVLSRTLGQIRINLKNSSNIGSRERRFQLLLNIDDRPETCNAVDGIAFEGANLRNLTLGGVGQ